MLRAISLLVITIGSAAGLAGSIHAEIPVRPVSLLPAGSGSGRVMRAAHRLAMLEIYLGISDLQRPAWRQFAQASMDLTRAQPDPSGRTDMFADLDALPDGLQARIQAAHRLALAADALKAALTPTQIARADLAWAGMLAPRPASQAVVASGL